jgi:outer membrane protein
VKTCSSLVRMTLLVAATAILMPNATAMAQKKAEKPQVSDEKVAELMKAALEQVQAGGQAVQQPQGLAQTARPVVDLKVDEAVDRALQNNIDLSVQRLNPQIQDLNLQATRAAYRPTVGSTIGYNDSTTNPTNTISGGSIVTTGRTTYNGSVDQSLPWMGGSVSLSFNNSRSSSNSNNARYNPSFSSSLTASLSQPLWRGRAIDSTRSSLFTGLISRNLADVSLRASTISTAAATRNAYWDLVYAVQAIAVSQESVRLAEQLVKDNQAKVEIGTLAPLDVVTAQAQLASARQSLVQAQQTRQQNELTLKRYIVGSTQDPLWNSTINPVDQPDPTVTAAPIDLQTAIRNALDQRTDLTTARENLRSSGITLKYQKDQIHPQADLTASYGASGTGGPYLDRQGQFGQVNAVIPGGYTDALSSIGRLDNPSWSLSVRFSYQLGRSAQEANYARAQIQYQQAQSQLKSQELSVATQVTQAALNVQSAFQQVQTARATRELREKTLEAEQSKFDVGMQTNYFVVQAQQSLADAKRSELQAILNYRKALVNFELAQQAPGGGA